VCVRERARDLVVARVDAGPAGDQLHHAFRMVGVCVCVREREKERVCVCVFVCVREREAVCV